MKKTATLLIGGDLVHTESNIKMFSDEIRTYYRFGKLGEQNYKNIVV